MKDWQKEVCVHLDCYHKVQLKLDEFGEDGKQYNNFAVLFESKKNADELEWFLRAYYKTSDVEV